MYGYDGTSKLDFLGKVSEEDRYKELLLTKEMLEYYRPILLPNGSIQYGVKSV